MAEGSWKPPAQLGGGVLRQLVQGLVKHLDVVKGVIAAKSTERPANAKTGWPIYETNTDRAYFRTSAGAWTPIGDFGSWQSYTPTMQVWTVGNGSLTGKYTQDGKLVTFKILYTVGSTSTFPAGSVKFSIPVTAKAANEYWPWPTVAWDVSAGLPYLLGTLSTETGNTTRTFATGGAVVSSTVPFTWATGDLLSIIGQYEAA